MFITQEKLNKCIDLVKKYGGTKLVLFGSALEDPDHANDLDLACEENPTDSKNLLTV